MSPPAKHSLYRAMLSSLSTCSASSGGIAEWASASPIEVGTRMSGATKAANFPLSKNSMAPLTAFSSLTNFLCAKMLAK